MHNIAIIGLGYVGLPVAVAFSAKHKVIGFDINKERVSALKLGDDITNEVDNEKLLDNPNLTLTSKIDDIKACNIFIVTVPTPVDAGNSPDLSAMCSASKMVAKYLKKGDFVIYESTVYPGATEEIMIPLLEKISGLALNADFGVGYSPERINPGDNTNRFETITKIVSGSDEQVAKFISDLYETVVHAGTFIVKNIKTAEAAKVIENTQRDVNIALINELTFLFNKLEISIYDVLDAANTKWNFLNFRPGLVGGHCIGIDPYYLVYKASQVGLHTKLISAGRDTNEAMANFVALSFFKFLIKKLGTKNVHNILVLGLTFKENCPDLRNSKVFSLISEFQQLGVEVDVFDPLVNESPELPLNINLLNKMPNKKYSGAVLAVNHDAFEEITISTLKKNLEDALVMDIKGKYATSDVDFKL